MTDEMPDLKILFGRFVPIEVKRLSCYACDGLAVAWPHKPNPGEWHAMARLTCCCGRPECKPFDVVLCRSCYADEESTAAAIMEKLAPDAVMVH
jgi:hypothetical protein